MTNGIQSTQSFDLLRMDRRIHARETRRRAAKLALFTGMVVVGIERRGWLGWIGAGLGLTGLLRELLQWGEGLPEWRKLASARQHQPGTLSRLLRPGKRAEVVDEASAYSFPASDSPSHDIH